MNSRLTIQDLAGLLADYTGKDKKSTEFFLREFLAVIKEGVLTDKIVKVKGLGTFKVLLVDKRESIHVNTGERFVIPEHYKFSFVPDKDLKELVNKPFSFFETTELNPEVDFVDLVESVEDDKISDDDESVEEFLPEKEEPVKKEPTKKVQVYEEEEVELSIQSRKIEEKPVHETEPKVIRKEVVIEEPEEEEEIVERKVVVKEKEIVRKAVIPFEEEEEEPIQTSKGKRIVKPLEEEILLDDESEEPKSKSVSRSKYREDSDNPYADDSWNAKEDITRNGGRQSSFKKTIVLVFSVALIAIIGVYIYLNKDVFTSLMSGRQVVTVDTTDLSSLYEESAQETALEIQAIKDSMHLRDSAQIANSLDSVPTIQEPTSVAKPEETVPATQAVAEKPANQSKEVIKTITIQSGDRLMSIAQEYYGNKLFWVYLYEYNKSKIRNPNSVPIGTQIDIPAPELYGIDANNRESLDKAAVKQTEILSD